MDLLPDLVGYIQGVVAIDRTGTVPLVTFQCQHCGVTEETIWTIAHIIFCPRHDAANGRTRLCPDCRITSLTAQGYDPFQARKIAHTGTL